MVFFIKIYSFQVNTSPANIITFDTLNKFSLNYDNSKMSLEISYQNVNDFSYAGTGTNNLKTDYFGKWIPISISMLSSTNPNIFPVISSATIFYNLLTRNIPTFNTYFVREFTFSNKFIGLISQIQFFNTFSINPWELAKEYYILFIKALQK